MKKAKSFNVSQKRMGEVIFDVSKAIIFLTAKSCHDVLCTCDLESQLPFLSSARHLVKIVKLFQ